MRILGIDTSCDDTAAAVVEDGVTIRSNVVASQVALHRRWGGIVPEVASRAHLERMLPVVEEALARAETDLAGIDAIGVTTHPGLVGALLVGLTTAKALAFALDIPLVGVHHIEAHVQASRLADPSLEPPFLALIVSGGHTQLFHVASDDEPAALIGETLDDAVGEAFDKVAAMLGLPYPGGPSIERAAKTGRRDAISFPRYVGKELDFSFSGLKTAVLYHLKGQDAVRGGLGPAREVSDEERADIAASFQEAAVDQLVHRVRRAVKRTRLRRVAVGGGVACNTRLREKLAQAGARYGFSSVFPPLPLCTDNAAMIAALAYFNLGRGRDVGMEQEAASR